MAFRSLILSLFLMVNSAVATSATVPVPELRSGSTLSVETLPKALQGVEPGAIVVLGEQHGTAVHQAYQMMVMRELRAMGLEVSVGLEFLESPAQLSVDEYRAGRLSEAEFLFQVNWSGFPFEFYREQILFPNSTAHTVALNVPQAVSRKIARSGLSALSPRDLSLLPPEFLAKGRGNDRYFQRFRDTMSGHVSDPTMIENYFLAQSAWDDTMAWRATEYSRANPDKVLVIIVGDFHVRFGGGLPDRLRQWGAAKVVTMSMINTHGMTDLEKRTEIEPSRVDGSVADWIWLSDF